MQKVILFSCAYQVKILSLQHQILTFLKTQVYETTFTFTFLLIC